MNLLAPSEDNNRSNGMTLMELLLVIALIIILAASTTPFLSRFILQTNLDATVDKLVGTIRKAQEYAMDGKDGAVWGVCKFNDLIRMYSGSCASPTMSEDFSIPATVTLVNFSDVTFNLRGEPSASLSITLTTSLESKTVELNTAGSTNAY